MTIRTDLTNEEHHALPDCIGSSGLRLMMRSPAHYWAAYIDPEREPREATPAQMLGTAWHTLVFEPEAFPARYAVVPEGLDRRTKEGKQLFADIEASGKHPLKPDEAVKVQRMASAARAHPVSQLIFDVAGGMAEATIIVTDPETGVRIRVRPDYMLSPGTCEEFPDGVIVDGKSTMDGAPAEFGRSSWGYGYHIQAALYIDAYMLEYGTTTPPAFLFLAQEKDPPFVATYYAATEAQIKEGRRLYREQLPRYAKCLERNKWPAYGRGIMPLETPPWVRLDDDDSDAVITA